MSWPEDLLHDDPACGATMGGNAFGQENSKLANARHI
jgi:hypothetical protein